MGVGGDGEGYFICDNYAEIAEMFCKYINQKYGIDIYKLEHYKEFSIVSDTSNENFVFTNSIPAPKHVDYLMIAKKDIKFIHTARELGFPQDTIIKGIENASI